MVWFLGCWHLPTWPDSECIWHRVLSLRVAKIWPVRGGASIPNLPGGLKILGFAQKSTKSPAPCSWGRQRDGAAIGWTFYQQIEAAAGIFPQMGSGPSTDHWDEDTGALCHPRAPG